MKDPAFLFYSQDFLTGTLFMTNEETGKYIRLLCAQHQQGGLVNKTSFDMTVGESQLLREKFIETEDGYYNERLMNEMVKREKKSTNLSANAKKRWVMQKQCKCTANVMPTEDVNEDVNVNIIKKDKKPKKEEIVAYCLERKNKIDPNYFFDYQEARGWKLKGGNAIKDWKAVIRTWEKNNFSEVKNGKRQGNSDGGFGIPKIYEGEPKPTDSEIKRNQERLGEITKKLTDSPH